MLDPAQVKDHLDEVEAKLAERATHLQAELAAIKALDAKRRAIIPDLETARRERKALGAKIAQAKKAGESADDLLAQGQAFPDRIKQQEAALDTVEQERRHLLLRLPNLPHDSVPRGTSEQDNQEVSRWGEPPSFEFTPKAHWDLGPELGLLDFERATKMSGARFAVLLGAGARLNRALIRLARFVVGIQLHAGDLSVEQGVRFFRDEAFMEEGGARREAERGTFDPGYVVYSAGKLMLLKLRADVEAGQSGTFSLKRFHDQLLGNGTIPFWMHRRLMLGDHAGAALD